LTTVRLRAISEGPISSPARRRRLSLGLRRGLQRRHLGPRRGDVAGDRLREARQHREQDHRLR